MNWLDHARREIQKSTHLGTANSAKRNPTAVMTVSSPVGHICGPSIGSEGSIPSGLSPDCEAALHEYEERAAIMEYGGGLSRDRAEREAWKLVAMRGSTGQTGVDSE